MLKRVLFSICTVLLCSSSLFSQGDATLSSDYNLGRIIGKGPLENYSGLQTDPDFLLTDIFSTQNGRDDSYNIGLVLYGQIQSYENLYYEESHSMVYLGIPQLSFSLAPNPAHRLGLSFLPLNTFFSIVDGEAFSGFEAPFIMLNSYQWNYLSRKGEIEVDQKDFDAVFYLGPLLNQGQFKTELAFAHPFSLEEVDFLIMQSKFLFGILDNWQVDLNFYYENVDSYYYLQDSPLNAGTMLRINNMTYELKYGLSVTEDQFIKASMNFISESDFSPNQLEGNWDGYFSNSLAKKQLKASLDFNSNLNQRNVLTLHTGYGLTNQLTLSSNLALTNFKKADFTLHTEFMNIRRRNYGPSEASKFEYLYGYQPRSGEVKADVWIKFPFLSSTEMWEYDAVSEYNGELYELFLPTLDNWSPLLDPRFEELLPAPNLGLNFSAGITENLIISDDFTLRLIDDYFRNFSIYYNRFKISFISHDSMMFSLGLGLFGNFDADPQYAFTCNLKAIF